MANVRGGFIKVTAYILFLPLLICYLQCLSHADDPPTTSAPAIRAFNLAVEQFNGRHFSEAIPFLDEAISADDDFAEAYYARGACRNYLKNYDGAMLDLSDAIRLKSSLLDARALRGEVYYEQDNWDQALDDFNYVLEHRPSDTITLLNRGVLYLKQENTASALKDFKHYLRLEPSSPQAGQVRKIVASLSGAGQEPESADQSDQQASAGPRATTHRPSAAAQRLADALMMQPRPMSEDFTRHVVRGENAQAVGDIHADEPDTAKPAGPQIVDPQ